MAGRLEAAGLRSAVHDGVGANPCAADVVAGSAALRAFGRAVIVAVDGLEHRGRRELLRAPVVDRAGGVPEPGLERPWPAATVICLILLGGGHGGRA